MELIKIDIREEDLIESLVVVWEKSVRATHHFLTEENIQEIKGYVYEAFKAIPVLVVAKIENQYVGFMGIADNSLEMLFVDPDSFSKGIGKQLLLEAINKYNVNRLAVNEQNPNAKGFYEHFNFVVEKRTDLDEQGNPFPILYMQLKTL